MTATPEPAGDDLDARIGETVHMLLFRRRMNQRALAAAMGVTPSVMSKKLRGHAAWSARQVQTAARALGVTVSELYGEKPASLPAAAGGGDEWAPSGSNRRPTDYKSATSGDVVNLAARRARRAGSSAASARRGGPADRRADG